LQELNEIGQVKLNAEIPTVAQGNNGETWITVKLQNPTAIPTILAKLTLIDKNTGERILPAYYSENYVSLLPGEERTVTVEFLDRGEKPAVNLRGWNLASTTIAVK
jgi:hypothetical protein